MAGKKNPMGKRRPADNPYVTIRNGQWVWKVLRAYVQDPNQPFARVHCVVETPFAQGADIGDTYWVDIRGEIVQLDDSLRGIAATVLPKHLWGPLREYYGSVGVDVVTRGGS